MKTHLQKSIQKTDLLDKDKIWKLLEKCKQILFFLGISDNLIFFHLRINNCRMSPRDCVFFSIFLPAKVHRIMKSNQCRSHAYHTSTLTQTRLCSLGRWVVSIILQMPTLQKEHWEFTKEARIALWWILLRELALLIWFFLCLSYSFPTSF